MSQLIVYPSFSSVYQPERHYLDSSTPENHDDTVKARIIAVRDAKLNELQIRLDTVNEELHLVKNSLKHRCAWLCFGGVVWFGGIIGANWAIDDKILSLNDGDMAGGLLALTTICSIIIGMAVPAFAALRLLGSKFDQYHICLARKRNFIRQEAFYNNYHEHNFLKFASIKLRQDGGNITSQRIGSLAFIDQVKQCISTDISISTNYLEH